MTNENDSSVMISCNLEMLSSWSCNERGYPDGSTMVREMTLRTVKNRNMCWVIHSILTLKGRIKQSHLRNPSCIPLSIYALMCFQAAMKAMNWEFIGLPVSV